MDTTNIEGMILLALYSDAFETPVTTHRLNNQTTIHKITSPMMFDEMIPSSSYCTGYGERIYAEECSLLMSHPSEIIGDEQEVSMLDEEGLLWIGLRKTNKAPRGLWTAGKYSHLYEVHIRKTLVSGSTSYAKHICPIDKIGNPVHSLINGGHKTSREYGSIVITCCSIIEDALRKDAMLCSIKDAVEIKFPVPIDDYKQFFSDRDGPYVGSRKKQIIHWVAQHLRRSQLSGSESTVKRHVRGIQEFSVDGLKIRIEHNDDGDKK